MEQQHSVVMDTAQQCHQDMDIHSLKHMPKLGSAIQIFKGLINCMVANKRIKKYNWPFLSEIHVKNGDKKFGFFYMQKVYCVNN